MTLVTADDKGRLCIRGTRSGQKYLVKEAGQGWYVLPAPDVALPEQPRNRNRRLYRASKRSRDLWDVLEHMGSLGLRIEESASGKEPVPPCRF